MSRIDGVVEYFNSLPEVKRIHELENFIDNNKEIKKLFLEIKRLQKQIVNSKEYNQIKQYTIQMKEYETLKAKLLDFPFVEEYLEALDIIYNELSMFTANVSDKLDKLLNGE